MVNTLQAEKPTISKYWLLFLGLLFLAPVCSLSQDFETNYYYRSSFYGSTTGQLPFWFTANVNGKVDPNSTNFLNQLAFQTNLLTASNFSVSAGSNLVVRLSENESIHFTQLYAKANYGAFQLDVGRFNQPIGLNNHELSIGSMMMSTNAIPINRISISNPDFVEVPFTSGIVEYKGMFSHGWFTEDRFVDDAYLHQKFLYLKLNAGRFSGIGGIVHNAMWGGTSQNPNIGRLPQSFSDYLRVITGSSADPNSDAPGGEISNVIGNSIAAYDFGLNIEFKTIDISATRLFYLEDGVSRRFRSPWDGVWGLNLYLKGNQNYVQAFTYEHINTRKQDSLPDQERGRANYYNHFIYRSGWSNFGRVNGIPLFTYNTETNRISNNLLVGHHIGLNGLLNDNLSYKLLATYSRNYGTVGEIIPAGSIDFSSRRQDQYSVKVDLNYGLPTINGLAVNVSLAGDFGEFYENTVGVMLGITWRNAFRF